MVIHANAHFFTRFLKNFEYKEGNLKKLLNLNY